MDLTKIFGNPVPPSVTKKANKKFKRYAKKFGFNEADFPSLALEKMPLGYDDFGIYSVVDKNKSGADTDVFDLDKGIILGTIRMGFGHCRMALALASAAKSMGYKPYWMDLMSFPDTCASKTIKYLEDWYNVGSRLSQRWGFFNKHIWEYVTSNAAQPLTYSVTEQGFSRVLTPLYHDLPKEMPFMSTHPWTGHAAVEAGMKNVVTIIPDNFPMAFHIAEGTLHCVQSPSAYMGYRSLISMGAGMNLEYPMPKEDILLTGHYVDHEIVSNIEKDCDNRLRRLKDKKTRRLLLTMGGAGAQVLRFAQIAGYCKADIEDKRVSLFINMGDHKGRWEDLKKEFERQGIKWQLHNDWKETRAFIAESEEGEVSGVHVFLHKEFYAAVYATNLLMRISDVMITKPSELSFYPVPKLFIQRVGRHEAWGAIRGSEIGDGTIETDSSEALCRTLKLLIRDDDLITLYCNHIIMNNKDGIYDGAYNSIRAALARAGRSL